MIAEILVTMLLAWIAGAVANWAADVLPHMGGVTPERPTPGSLRHYLTAGLSGKPPATAPHHGPIGSAEPATQPSSSVVRPSSTRHSSLITRHSLLAAAMLLAFLAAWYFLRPDPLALGVAWLYTAYLLTVLVIDFEHRRVLNLMLGPAAVVVFLFSFLPVTPTPLEALLGGAAGFVLFFIVALIGRRAMGAGDVKLAGLIGLMTGFPAVFTALVVGIVLGGVAALFLLITRRASRKSYMAYAPYLSLGALVTLLQIL